MFGKMRVISSLLLSAVMLLLLTFRVLPHHHHALHIPGSDAVIETLHFGTEACQDGGEVPHDDHESCPSEHSYYIAAECEELDYYKHTQNAEWPLAIFCAVVELSLAADVTVHAPPHVNIKIPDSRVAVLSLRAPPYTV